MLQNADNLGLCLSLREIYLQRFAEVQKVKALEFSLFASDKLEKNLKALKQVISKSTSTYPRLHSSVSLVIKEI